MYGRSLAELLVVLVLPGRVPMVLRRIGLLLSLLLPVAIWMQADAWQLDARETGGEKHHHRSPPQPTPEPASLAMLGTGLLGLAVGAYKNKKKDV
jgi:hypothetical protein